MVRTVLSPSIPRTPTNSHSSDSLQPLCLMRSSVLSYPHKCDAWLRCSMCTRDRYSKQQQCEGGWQACTRAAYARMGHRDWSDEARAGG